MKLHYDVFTSRDCKLKDHIQCAGEWEGGEIEVICNCDCHKKENVQNKKNNSLGPRPENQAQALGPVERLSEANQGNGS